MRSFTNIGRPSSRAQGALHRPVQPNDATMNLFSGRPGLPIEYYVLADPSGEGPVIGYLAGKPFTRTVIDRWGHRYRYVGLAARHRNGQYDVRSLHPGEWIVPPGLVYALESAITP
jgi:hypothetical protein